MSTVKFFVFDIESVADGELVSRLRYPGENLDPITAIARYRRELLEDSKSDFIPYTYQLPIAIAIAKIAPDFQLLDLVALDEPQFRPNVMTNLFWKGWERYNRPTFVSFNGRTFDLPLMELAAFRYGISLPEWFNHRLPSYQQPRNRYNQDAHLDLQDLLTNFGTTRFTGGLNLVANLLGKPGKVMAKGHEVQDLYNDGEVQKINDYCRCDVLDTYFAFLRSRVLVGEITLEREQQLVALARSWILEKAKTQTGYQVYLKFWGDWQNPWKEPEKKSSLFTD